MSNPALARDEAFWQLIQPPNSILSSRFHAIVFPLNAYEIAILGGCCIGLDYGDQDLNDVILFDTKTEKCRKVVGSGPFKFDGIRN